MSPIARLRRFFDRLFAARSEAGPYRFALRNWKRISDVRIARALAETDFLLSEVELVRLPLERFERVLVLAPHQDDEAIGPGGTLTLLAGAGAHIDIVYVTDGAQKRSGLTPEEVRAARAAEARAVADRLGASVHELGVSNIELDFAPAHVDRLAALLEELAPRAVLCPWLLDSPPIHRLGNLLFALAGRRARLFDREVWGYQVHNGLLANAYVDITEVAEQKRELIRLHASQIDRYRPYDHIALGLNAWNTHLAPEREIDSTPRYFEAFSTMPFREFERLVRRWYPRDPAATYSGDDRAIRAAARLTTSGRGTGR